MIKEHNKFSRNVHMHIKRTKTNDDVHNCLRLFHGLSNSLITKNENKRYC